MDDDAARAAREARERGDGERPGIRPSRSVPGADRDGRLAARAKGRRRVAAAGRGPGRARRPGGRPPWRTGRSGRPRPSAAPAGGKGRPSGKGPGPPRPRRPWASGAAHRDAARRRGRRSSTSRRDISCRTCTDGDSPRRRGPPRPTRRTPGTTTRGRRPPGPAAGAGGRSGRPRDVATAGARRRAFGRSLRVHPVPSLACDGRRQVPRCQGPRDRIGHLARLDSRLRVAGSLSRYRAWQPEQLRPTATKAASASLRLRPGDAGDRVGGAGRSRRWGRGAAVGVVPVGPVFRKARRGAGR